MDSLKLGRSNSIVSVIGQGCSTFGFHEKEEIEAIHLGLDLGMTLIDTAEDYSYGLSEKVIGKAINERRDESFIATKVSPTNLSYDRLLKSAKKSLDRLKIDTIDLYQIHFPNPTVPIKETMKAMEKLVNEGYIQHIGVSNFSIDELKEAQTAMSKEEISSIQVPYNLLQRNIEIDLLPYCQKEHITVIAYSPLAAGKIISNQNLSDIAANYIKSTSQVALNWVISKKDVVVIPRSSKLEHVKMNAGSCGWRLSSNDVKTIDLSFNEYVQTIQHPDKSIKNSVISFIHKYLPRPMLIWLRKILQ